MASATFYNTNSLSDPLRLRPTVRLLEGKLQALPMDSAHGQCPWAVSMGGAHGQCPWAVPMGGAHGQCSWAMPMGGGGLCPWAVVAHGRSLPMGGRCPWAV